MQCEGFFAARRFSSGGSFTHNAFVRFHWNSAPYRLDPVTSTTLRLLQLKHQYFISSQTQRHQLNQPHFLLHRLCTPLPAMANPANGMYAPPLHNPLLHCCYVTSSYFLWTPVTETRARQRIPYARLGGRDEGPRKVGSSHLQLQGYKYEGWLTLQLVKIFNIGHFDVLFCSYWLN